MPVYMARAIIHTVDALQENFVQNQFCIDTLSADLEVNDVTTAIQTFYRSFTGFYPSTIAQTGHELKFYEMPGVQPNYPVYETAWTFSTAPSGAAGPSEIALCVSFAGQRVPGQAQPRRRGRIYIGPWDGTYTSAARPTSGDRTALANACAALWDDIAAIPSHTWSVWSTVNQTPTAITGGWVDDAWDVQRRRGLVPSTRTTWTAPV